MQNQTFASVHEHFFYCDIQLERPARNITCIIYTNNTEMEHAAKHDYTTHRAKPDR